jgi:DNA-binding MurR/RpiR family transcriptional regulator
MADSPGVPASKQVLSTIRVNLGSLTPGERKVAMVVLESPSEVIHMTVGELAQRADTAESTAVRLCHRLGYAGYQDLKIRLARELVSTEPAVRSEIDGSAEPHEILRTVLSFNIEALRDITSSISAEQFDLAANAIAGAHKVLLLGFGSSFLVCQEAHERLASVGVDAAAPDSPNMKLLLASRSDKTDVVVCVSHTGATKEVIRYAEVAKRAGATVIAVTSFARTPLAEVADIPLIAGGQQLDFRFDAMSARIAHLAVLDAIYISLPHKLGERSTQSLNTFYGEEAAWRI